MWFKKKGQAVVENITNINPIYPELKYKVTISMNLGEDLGGGMQLEVCGEDRLQTEILMVDMIERVKAVVDNKWH
jgi:hypothetical protein